MGVPVKVWLGGEGPNEIGGRGHDPPTERPGFLEVMLLRLEPSGWRVAGATTWNRIRKYRSGIHNAEERNVRGLVLEAWEAGCEVVAFVRDVDSDPDRARKIEAAVEAASAVFERPPIAIIGGAACPALEGWLLALLGERDTDAMSRPRSCEGLAERGVRVKDTSEVVAIVEDCTPEMLESLAPGTDSLKDWLKLARTVMCAVVHGTAAPAR
jgi:hypothetical protein